MYFKFPIQLFSLEKIIAKCMLTDKTYNEPLVLINAENLDRKFSVSDGYISSPQHFCPNYTCFIDYERFYNICLYRQLQLHNGVQCLHFVLGKMSNIITNESPSKGFPLFPLLDLIGGLKPHSIIYNQRCAELGSVCSQEINKIQRHLCN